jgi:hypothetical protein
MTTKPTRFKFTTLKQLCEQIPPYLVPKLARKHGVDKKARTFSPWSHVITMLYAQLTHALSLNDVCDALRMHGPKLFTIRGATAPSRNALSHANKVRSAAMAEELFWDTLGHLTKICPRFGGRTYRGVPRRFKRLIHVVDASTIALVANCIDWARHRRKKAAAKLHLRLNLQSFLPRFAIIDTARLADPACARAMCAGIGKGEIVIFDKAYVDFGHLFELTGRGVFWVTLAKDNMQYRCRRRLIKKRRGNILRDDLIVLTRPKTHGKYPEPLRLIRAIVEIDGKPTELTFITNNLEWSAHSVTDLYKSRWGIEAFFKQIKQSLQLCDFLGHGKNAIQWQVWMALLLYVLLRFLAFVNDWSHSFSRLFCMMRSVIWDLYKLVDLLRCYGTARGSFRMLAAPQQAYLPGFEAYFKRCRV